MGNLFANLPAPATANGAGDAVDVSAFGASKTVVIAGSWPVTQVPLVTIEINNDPTKAGSWNPIATRQGGGILAFESAAMWMRQRVSSNRSGTPPRVDVGGTDDGTSFAALPSTSADGAGAAVDVSALGVFKTITVGGTFNGVALIEVSEDGTTNWAQAFSFSAPGQQSMLLTAHWMRTRRQGVPVIAPGQPVVNLGAVATGGGGLASVTHDTTMRGDGNATPLSVIAVDGGTRWPLANNQGADVPAGSPVYADGDGAFKLANASLAASSFPAGLTQSDIADGATGFVQTHGPISLTTDQWDAICGTTGGLVAGTRYYLDVAAGTLTPNPPSGAGQSITLCIQAFSTTDANICIQPPILL